MDKVLQKLLESEVLSEETKTSLVESITAVLEQLKQQTIEETTVATKAEIYQSWVAERTSLVEAIDSKLNEFVELEIDELKEDIESFRDLEAEFAERIVEAKAEMAVELKQEMGEFVNQLDGFLSSTINEEFEQLKDDINESKKYIFGRRLFEAFEQEFSSHFANYSDLQETVTRTEEKLNTAADELKAKEKKLKVLERKIKMESVLSALTGRQREVMEAILQNVATEQLDEGYKTFIGRVIGENMSGKSTTVVNKSSEKETSVLAEQVALGTKQRINAVVKTGDFDSIDESADMTLQAEELLSLRRLAGIE
jgi:predicted  nucleic acid-binding Zn-ribbon protein